MSTNTTSSTDSSTPSTGSSTAPPTGSSAGASAEPGTGARAVAPEAGPRPARLIHNEATTEIPVHLLFRDDPDPAPVPLRPAVVARRQGPGGGPESGPRPGAPSTPAPARCRRSTRS